MLGKGQGGVEGPAMRLQSMGLRCSTTLTRFSRHCPRTSMLLLSFTSLSAIFKPPITKSGYYVP